MSKLRTIPAWKKADKTDRWTEILFRALTSRVAKRWRFVSFRGTGGGEWRGIVDVLAIRKNTSPPKDNLLKAGDVFDVVVVQMKGGKARMPRPSEVERLRAVARRYRAKDIVLFEWTKGQRCRFSRWRGGNWRPVKSAAEVFG